MRAYAGALLESASEDEIPEVLRGLKLLGKAFRQENFTDIVYSPNIAAHEKIGIIKDLLKVKGIDSPALISGIDVIVDKRREGILENLYKTYESLAYNRENISKALVITAFTLNEADIKAIKEKLKELLNRQIELEIEQDRSLIGGIKVFVDDQELDLSIGGQLKKMSKQMISEKR